MWYAAIHLAVEPDIAQIISQLYKRTLCDFPFLSQKLLRDRQTDGRMECSRNGPPTG